MRTILSEIRYAIRTLRRSPLFALITILTLALGIGANTAIFSLLNSLIRPLNVPEPNRLVRVFSGPGGGSYEISYPNFVDLRGFARSFSALAVYSSPQPMSLGLLGSRGIESTDRVWGTVVSGNYFETLRIPAAVGRTFAADEDRVPSARPVMVISHRLWVEKFHADAGVIGLPVRLNGHVFKVIGVAPDRILQAGLLLANDLWVPMMMEGEAMPGQSFKLTNRSETFLSVIGRMRAGVSLSQARAEATNLASRFELEYPNENHQFGLSVLTERESRIPFLPGLERFGWMVLVVVSLVLATACANIAGLMMVRSLARRKEFGIRLSLGAGRWQLMRQLLSEAMVFSLCGGLLGLAVASLGARALLRLTPPLPLEISLDTSLDYRTLLFALGASVSTGVLCCALPAFRSTRVDLNGIMKAGDTELGPRSARMLSRNVLVVGQIAVSLVLLVTAGLFVRSLIGAQHLSLGFEPAHRLLASADTFLANYSEEQSRAFDTKLLAEVRSMPGVIDATSTAFAPLSGGYLGDGHAYIEGETPIPDYDRPKVFYDRVGPDFLRTMGTPLLTGRDFTERDITVAAPVAVVNQTFADSFWPGQNPVGKHLRLNSNEGPWMEVVGLVPDGKYRSLGELPQPHLFLAGHSSGLVVHTASDPSQYMQAIRSAVRSMDPSLAVVDMQTMEEHLGLAFYPARMSASLLSVFSVVGVSLAMLGLYGLLAFVIRRRTRELGIRIALGAQKRDVMWLVVREGGLLVALGIGIGLVTTSVVGSLVEGMLYGVSVRDPLTYTVISILLGVASLAAICLPAMQAASVNPSVSLKYE